ncbi:MAG: hypothetical protein AVO38_14495 [delta proteobacterium ML8_D]|nr:MAG: hypothetical protein AVO38_14495 [delta proteobacterium ML8_D]
MNAHKAFEPKVVLYLFFILFTLLLLTNHDSVHAKSIGYDENTEIVVRGTIKHCTARSYMQLQCFTLQSKTRVFRVIVAPQWFVRRIGLKLKDGTNVEVVGSKFFGRDGCLCLSARSLKFLSSGRNIMLRDGSCKPVWQNSCVRESSCIRIFYQSQ